MTELNVVTQLNLFITVAACVGAAMAKVISMGDRAPYWGLIGPTEDTSAGALEDAYRALYTTFFRTKSARESVDALRASSTKFWTTTAQGMFEKGWENFEKTQGQPDAVRTRAEALLNTLSPGVIAAKQLTTESVAQRMLDAKPVVYRRYVETFFMCDLHPEHRGRFEPLTTRYAQ